MEHLGTYDGKSVVQSELIEQEWANKAFHHAEVYADLLASFSDHSQLRLSKHDDRLHDRFLELFPEIDVAMINEERDFKSAEAKEKWRKFIAEFEDVADFNFGTLLRADPAGEYLPDNTIFVVRVQFLCVEAVRNRRGLNQVHYKRK